MRRRDSIVVPGADAVLLWRRNAGPEAAPAKNGTMPTPESNANFNGHCVLLVAKFSVSLNAAWWTRTSKHLKGVGDVSST